MQKWKFEQIFGVTHRHMWQTEHCHTMSETTQMACNERIWRLIRIRSMNSYKHHFYSTKQMRQVGISTRDQYCTCNCRCGCHPPPHLLRQWPFPPHLLRQWPFYLYTIQLRKPSKKRDCTNSFVWHIVNPFWIARSCLNGSAISNFP